jgi:chromate reductase
MSKKVLFIIGSMRKDSFNRQLSDMAEKLLGGAEVSRLEYSDIPFMNQDIEFPAPARIAEIRAQVAAADGIWIFSPEYNYSYPGVLKNLLDWLSRPLKPNDYASGTAVTGKKVTVSSAAGKSAGAGSREKLLELLGKMGMNVVGTPAVGVAVNGESWGSGRLVLEENDEKQLRAQAAAFLAAME